MRNLGFLLTLFIINIVLFVAVAATAGEGSTAWWVCAVSLVVSTAAFIHANVRTN